MGVENVQLSACYWCARSRSHDRDQKDERPRASPPRLLCPAPPRSSSFPLRLRPQPSLICFLLPQPALSTILACFLFYSGFFSTRDRTPVLCACEAGGGTTELSPRPCARFGIEGLTPIFAWSASLSSIIILSFFICVPPALVRCQLFLVITCLLCSPFLTLATPVG